jgi:predicted small lipoprotein YifL
MNRNNTIAACANRDCTSGWARRYWSGLLVAAALLVFTGCEQPKPLELAKPLDEDAPSDARTPRPKQDGDTPAQPYRRRQFSEREPTPTPGPTPTPSVFFDPEQPDTATHLVLKPSDFQASAGEPDGEGGWVLQSNGVLHIPERRIPFEIYKLEIEVKGEPVGDIWPEFHLALYHHGLRRNLQIMPTRSNFAVTREWQTQSFELAKPLPAGQYRLDFRMLNAYTDEQTSASRKLHVRRIIFKGAKSLAVDLTNE